MTRIKAHRKALAIVLVLMLWAAWYSRPVDIYGLGMGELEAISVSVQHNEPGQGVDILWSTGATPDDGQWQVVLEELERLRFRRPPGNPIREYYQSQSIQTEVADQTSTVFHLVDQTGRYMILQIGAGHSSYTALHTSRNLPLFLSGGEDTAQALALRLPEI